MNQAEVEADVSGEELRERMVRKRKAIDLMELSFAEDAARFAATDEYDELGFVSAIDWIRFNCHMTSGGAADRVAVGKTMGRLPRSVEAQAQGEIGLAHVTVLARRAEAPGWGGGWTRGPPVLAIRTAANASSGLRTRWSSWLQAARIGRASRSRPPWRRCSAWPALRRRTWSSRFRSRPRSSSVWLAT